VKTVWILCFLVLVGCGSGSDNVQATSTSPAEATTSAETGFVGKPGPPPKSKTMSVAEYGAYSYASPENFCHMTAFVISGTVAPQHAGESKPTTVARGTKVQVLDRASVECESVSMDLIHIHILDGAHAGEDRYVLDSDFHTEDEYSQFAQKQAEVKKQHAILVAREKGVTYPLLTTPDMMQDKHPHCDLGGMAHYVGMARTSFASGSYRDAKRYAESAVLYGDDCRNADSASDHDFGLAMLTKSKAELRLGELTKAKDDADIAAGTFFECADEPSRYSSDQVDDCRRYRVEAHNIAND